VAAGAEVCLTTRTPAGEIPDHDRYWNVPTTPRPGPPGAALDLLARSVDEGATVVTVGPFTNLALLEVTRPGRLGTVPVVTMGGWTRLPPAGFPPWEAAYDFNVQSDAAAADYVFRTAGAPLTIVGLDVTVQVPLRGAHLDRLRAAGPVGEVLARSSLAHGADYGNATVGARHAGLPDDLVNYHHDPLACAVAVGWDGVRVEERRLSSVMADGVLSLVPDDDGGRPVRVVTAVDAEAFGERWLAAVEAIVR
jgi:inosine-uridine nucleoside N-ribohydrolase